MVTVPKVVEVDSSGEFVAMVTALTPIHGNYTISAADEHDNVGSATFTVPDMTGPQGPKGDTGARRAAGPKGDTGPMGPQGPEGPMPNLGPIESRSFTKSPLCLHRFDCLVRYGELRMAET
jgi:hypothetical protein